MCGAVRYRISKAPERVSHCHCETCRRSTGAVAATFAVVDTDAVEWRGEAAKVYRSSDFATRRFCPHCGSQLAFAYDERPGETAISVGTLDDASAWPAIRHNFVSERIPWVTLDPHLPAKPRWWTPPQGRE
jgi:hypothetical protein